MIDAEPVRAQCRQMMTLLMQPAAPELAESMRLFVDPSSGFAALAAAARSSAGRTCSLSVIRQRLVDDEYASVGELIEDLRRFWQSAIRLCRNAPDGLRKMETIKGQLSAENEAALASGRPNKFVSPLCV